MQKFRLLFTSALIYLTLAPYIANNVLAQEGQTYGPIESGDRLWTIGGKVSPTSVSRYQAILTLHRANPHAFRTSCNMNSSLTVGEYLNVPSLSEMHAISRADAFKEFKRQDEEWRNRRQNPIICPDVVVQPPEVGQSTAETAEDVTSASNGLTEIPETPTEESIPPTIPSMMATGLPTSTADAEPNTAGNTQRMAHVPDDAIGDNTQNSSGFSSMMIAILVVGGLFAVVVLMVLLHKRAKKKAQENDTTDDQ